MKRARLIALDLKWTKQVLIMEEITIDFITEQE